MNKNLLKGFKWEISAKLGLGGWNVSWTFLMTRNFYSLCKFLFKVRTYWKLSCKSPDSSLTPSISWYNCRADWQQAQLARLLDSSQMRSSKLCLNMLRRWVCYLSGFNHMVNLGFKLPTSLPWFSWNTLFNTSCGQQHSQSSGRYFKET